MSRFEPLHDPSGPPARPIASKPARPPAVELAAAILIVGGTVNLVGAVLAAGGGGTGDPFLWLTVALNVVSVVLGLFARVGRLWLVTINYAAILGFLDLLGGSVNPAAVMLGLAEILVVVILFRHKPWFDALRVAVGDAGRPTPP